MRQDSGSLITHAQRDEGSLSTHRWHLYDNSNHFHTPMSFHTGLDYVQMDFSNHLRGEGSAPLKARMMDWMGGMQAICSCITEHVFFFFLHGEYKLFFFIFFLKSERQRSSGLLQKGEEGRLEIV